MNRCEFKSCPLADGAPLRDWRRGAGSCILSPFTLPPKTPLFFAGQEAGRVFLVRTGIVRTFLTLEDGREQGLRLVGPGGLVGAEAIRSREYRVSAMAVTDTVACGINIDTLRDTVRESPSAMEEFIIALVDELNDAYERTAELGQRSSRERVASCLVRFTQGGKRRVPLLQRDLAEHLGMAPETLNRVLHEFARKGLVEVRGRKLSVLDPEGLAGLPS